MVSRELQCTSKKQVRYHNGVEGIKQIVQDQNRKGKRKISRMVQKQTKGKKVSPNCFKMLDSQSVHTHANIPWKYTQHGQFSSLGWHLDSVHSLRRWVIYVELWWPFFCFLLFVFCFVFFVLFFIVKLDCFAVFMSRNSFDILSWLPEVPWVGKATVPFGQLFQ